MPTPIAESILADIATAWAGISGIISVNRGKWVAPQEQVKADKTQFPYINMGTVSLVNLDIVASRTYKRLTVEGHGHIIYDETVGFSTLQTLISNMESSVMADPTRSGFASDTRLSSATHPGIIDEFGFTSCLVAIEVDYPHDPADPTIL